MHAVVLRNDQDLIGGVLPELRVTLRPEQIGEFVDVAVVRGFIDTDALIVRFCSCHVASEPPGGHVPLLGLRWKLKELRQGTAEHHLPERRL